MTDSTNTPVDVSLVDVVLPDDTGYPSVMSSQDTIGNLRGMGARDFPDHLWIEPSDWKDVARENDRHKTWPEDWRNRFTNQTPTHECTCHALTQGFECAWNRQRASKSSPVFVSQLSIYSEANPRKWGGSSMQHTLGIAMRRGFLPEHAGPNSLTEQKDRFRHTINGTNGRGNAQNSSGNWVPLDDFPDDWKQTAKHLRPLEVINPESWEQIVCLVLHGIVVCVGRSGHAIPYVQIVWDGDLYAKYSDSYDVHRYDSIRNIRRGVGGSYAIYTTTVPDNWDRPVGDMEN